MVKEDETQEITPIQKRIFQLLSFPFHKESLSIIIAIIILFTSLVSSGAAILETNIVIRNDYQLLFFIIEIVSGSFFFLEFLLRYWSIDAHPKYEKEKSKGLNYLFSIMGFIDFLSALSFIVFLLSLLLPMIYNFSLVLRLVVLFKFIRYSESFDIIWAVVKRKKEELLITLMLSLMLLFFGSILIFIAEHQAQPRVFTNLFSSMWFTAINLFTIGYGEIVPITTFGKVVSGIISVLGVTLFLLPASVIASGFIDELKERNPNLDYDVCLNCKEKLRKSDFLLDIYKKRRGRPSKALKKAREAEQKKEPIVKTPIQEKQKNIYKLLEFPFPKSTGQIISFFFFMTILALNVLAIMVGTNPILAQEVRPLTDFVLFLSIGVFTLSYILRIWTCVESGNQDYVDPIRGRIKYALNPLMIMDLIVLASLYLTLFIDTTSFLFLYIQVFRLLVVLKIGHFVDVFSVVSMIFRATLTEFITAILICTIFLIFTSSIIFIAENEAQPEKFKNIPATFWFGISTFTTTGFGDLYPITTMGRFLTVCFAFIGVALFTLPAGILGSSFFSSIQEYRLHKVCPKCGHVLSRPKLRKG